MNELVFLNNEDKPVTTSLKIAEIFGKNHKDLLRKIKEKTSLFTERNFAPSEYEDSTGRNLPMYILDRDFTTYLIMGFTGQKADEWKLKYINAFNEMEKAINKPMTTEEKIKVIAQSNVDLNNKIETVKNDLEEFKLDLPLLGIECQRITRAKNQKVVPLLGGKESNAYKDNKLRGKVYSDIQHELDRQFGVKSYKEIKRCQVDKAIEIIKGYELPMALVEQVRDCNAQMSL